MKAYDGENNKRFLFTWISHRIVHDRQLAAVSFKIRF